MGLQRVTTLPTPVMRSSLGHLQASAGNRVVAGLARRRAAGRPLDRPSDAIVQRQAAPSRDEHAAFVLDDEKPNLIEGRSLAPKNMFHTTTKKEFIDKFKSLKQVKPSVTTIHIISHGAIAETPKDEDRGVVFFSGESPTRVPLSALAKEVAAGLGGGLSPAPAIFFRGCRVGNAEASMEEFRQAVGGSTASGTTCKTIIESLGPIILECSPPSGSSKVELEIKSRQDLTEFRKLAKQKCNVDLTAAEVETKFDEDLKAAIAAEFSSFKPVPGLTVIKDRRDCVVPLEKGQTHTTSLPIVKKAYFDNNGEIVSTWTVNLKGLSPLPGPCFKDLVPGGKTCELVTVSGKPGQKKPGGTQACLPADIPDVVLTVADRSAADFGEAATAESAEHLVGLRRGDGLVFGTFDRRDRVRDLQQRLNDRVGAGLSDDGMFGGGTADALARFQEAVDLTGSDVVDEPTADALSGAEPGPTSSSDLVGLRRGDGLVVGTFGQRPRVTKLQALLTGWGFATAADGMWGPKTQGVFNQFQVSRLIPAGELVDPVTADALEGRTQPPEVCLDTA